MGSLPPHQIPDSTSVQLQPGGSAPQEILCFGYPEPLPNSCPPQIPRRLHILLQTLCSTIPTALSRAQCKQRPVPTNKALGSDSSRVKISGPSLPSYMTLDKSLNVSGPQFLPVLIGNNHHTYSLRTAMQKNFAHHLKRRSCSINVAVMTNNVTMVFA